MELKADRNQLKREFLIRKRRCGALRNADGGCDLIKREAFD